MEYDLYVCNSIWIASMRFKNLFNYTMPHKNTYFYKAKLKKSLCADYRNSNLSCPEIGLHLKTKK